MTKTSICSCGKTIEYEPSERWPDLSPGICDDCVAATRSREREQARYAERAERNVPPRYRCQTFATFVAVTPSQGSALAAVRDHAGQGVFLLGNPGCGKTHLAAAAVMVGPGGSLFASSTELLDDIRAGFDGNGRGLFERAKSTPLLALDDLGSEAVKDWGRERLQALLDWRWNQQLPVIATTNCRPKTISERIGEPAMSRLAGLCQHRIDMQGPDMRQQQHRPTDSAQLAQLGESEET